MSSIYDTDPMACWQAELGGNGLYPAEGQLLAVPNADMFGYRFQENKATSAGQSPMFTTRNEMPLDSRARSPWESAYNSLLHEQAHGENFDDSEPLVPITGSTMPWTPQNLQHQGPDSRKAKVPMDLSCEFCGRVSKNTSDAGRHLHRHTRPFICLEEHCPATRGFASKHDLERHKKSVHGLVPKAGSREWYVCPVGGREHCRKMWPRLDNLRAHVRRSHPGVEGWVPLVVDPDGA